MLHSESERRRQPDRTGDLGDRLVDHLLGGIQLGEDQRSALVIGLADIGGLGALGAAGEQAGAELLLEPRDAAAENRLGHPHALRRAREGAGLDHANEGEHVEQVDRGAFHLSQHHGDDRPPVRNVSRLLSHLQQGR